MSMFQSKMSNVTGASRPPLSRANNQSQAKFAGGAEQAEKSVYPPAIPSNLNRDADQDVIFNSIGFYSDLLTRLDGQIKSTEEVYLTSQMKVSQAQDNPASFL